MSSFSLKQLGGAALLLNLLLDLASASVTAKQLYKFPDTPYETPENVAVRPNGDLLITITSTPTIWTLDPSQSNPTAKLVHTFSNATSTLGITETYTDVYAVAVGTSNVTTRTGTPGSFSIWSVNYSGSSSTPTVTEVAPVPEASILNGVTHLKGNPDVVLAVDSESGNIWSINVRSKAVSIAIPSSTFGSGRGINGIHVDNSGKYLYFTNSGTGEFGRIPINATTGAATGSSMAIATNIAGNIFDDFALDSQGNAYITDHSFSIVEVTTAGKLTTVYNNTNLDQPTSAIFSADGQTLYVVTAGTIGSTSGQVFALNI